MSSLKYVYLIYRAKVEAEKEHLDHEAKQIPHHRRAICIRLIDVLKFIIYASTHSQTQVRVSVPNLDRPRASSPFT